VGVQPIAHSLVHEGVLCMHKSVAKLHVQKGTVRLT